MGNLVKRRTSSVRNRTTARLRRDRRAGYELHQHHSNGGVGHNCNHVFRVSGNPTNTASIPARTASR